MNRILVIKHGALGDLVLATGAFAAIRKRHAGDHITVLTTPPFAELLRASPYFDEVWTDKRPKLLLHPFAFFRLIEKIRGGRFTRIYDLQSSERTAWYHWLMCKPRPEWSGTAKCATHRYLPPAGARLHTIERQKQQLALADIHHLPAPDISWLTSDAGVFRLPEQYVLIVPGGSSHRPGKRWPAINYGQLCLWLAARGITPVLIGTQAELSVLSTIEALCQDARNLRGQTSFADIAQLARGALGAVGNDTGPMHLIAVTGCTSLVLFSQFSDPALCAPRGENVTVMSEPRLTDLPPERVIENFARLIATGAPNC